MSARLGWFAISLAPWLWRHTRHLDDENVSSLLGTSVKSLRGILGVDHKTAQAVARSLAEGSPAQKLASVERTGVSVLTRADAEYPDSLRTIYDPPAALYCRGRLKPSTVAVALVGSRRATPAGRAIATEMAAGLAAVGVTVISGLARGIDGAAHQGALQTGATWAVLGNSLDIVYPPEHRQLAADITKSGVLLSEYPPGTPPRPLHFPARNRLISGLSNAVVVVEAAARSGALITADFALEHGRDVFAVPGPVRSRASVGCHRLLQQGAGLVTSAADILDALELSWRQPSRPTDPDQLPKSDDRSLPGDQQRLLDAIPFEPTLLDDIVCGMNSEQLLATLTELELEGRVARCEGGAYCRLD